MAITATKVNIADAINTGSVPFLVLIDVSALGDVSSVIPQGFRSNPTILGCSLVNNANTGSGTNYPSVWVKSVSTAAGATTVVVSVGGAITTLAGQVALWLLGEPV